MKCQEKLDWMYPAGSANSIKFLPALKLVVTVEKAVNSLGCGIFTLQQVVDELRKDIPDIEWRLVSVTLKKLHEMVNMFYAILYATIQSIYHVFPDVLYELLIFFRVSCCSGLIPMERW